MSNLSKIVATALVILALILGVFAFRLARQPAPAPAPPAAPVQQAAPRIDVVVAARAIAAGTVIARQDLRTERWQAAPAQAHNDVQALVGQSVRVDLAAGEPVLDSTLMRGIAGYLVPGERAVTIAVDDISGAAGRIRPGDRVDVFFSLPRGNEVDGTQSRLLQSRLRVLAFGGESIDGPVPGTPTDKDAANRGRPNAPARQAILAVPVEQVNELLLASRSGAVQLALRAPQDDAAPDTALFAAREPVLSGKPGLTAAQRERLDTGINRAFAGDSLPALSGPAPAPVRVAAPSGRGASRTIEVVRGGERETVRY